MKLCPIVAVAMTPRQQKIAALLLEGKSNPEIAAALQVSPASVRNHLRKLSERSGLGWREGRIRLAMVLAGVA
jgi:DNA-binding NarL/FixJ family response regulator